MSMILWMKLVSVCVQRLIFVINHHWVGFHWFLVRKNEFFCRTSSVNISGQDLEMDLETCKALNYIESGTDSIFTSVHDSFFFLIQFSASNA